MSNSNDIIPSPNQPGTLLDDILVATRDMYYPDWRTLERSWGTLTRETWLFYSICAGSRALKETVLAATPPYVDVMIRVDDQLPG